MAIVTTDDKHYKDIAYMLRSAYRDAFNVDACGMEFKPSEMALALADIVSRGFVNNYNKGYSEGIEQGKQEAYNAFWDAYQDNGNKANYNYAFAGDSWTSETLKPKYDVVPLYAANMFYHNTALNLDITEHFKSIGKTLDFSKSTSFSSMLMYSTITGIGVIDTRSATSIDYIFRYATSLKTVEKLILKNDGSQTIGNYAFDRAALIEDITIEGVIGQTINMQHSTKLSKASITSVVNALSTTTGGLTVTFSRSAVNNAFTNDEWNALIVTKSNWTISLV